MNRFLSGDGSTHNVEAQEDCMKSSAWEGLKAGLGAVAASTVAVLGATKAFPAFNKSLSVSSKTGLIVSPMFAAFVLAGELELNQCAQKYRDLHRAQRAAIKPTVVTVGQRK